MLRRIGIEHVLPEDVLFRVPLHITACLAGVAHEGAPVKLLAVQAVQQLGHNLKFKHPPSGTPSAGRNGLRELGRQPERFAAPLVPQHLLWVGRDALLELVERFILHLVGRILVQLRLGQLVQGARFALLLQTLQLGQLPLCVLFLRKLCLWLLKCPSKCRIRVFSIVCFAIANLHILPLR